VPAQPLPSTPFFGTSGLGAAALPCLFMPSSLWGLLRASELASLPKKDIGLPGDEQMFLALGRRGQPGVTRARSKGSTQNILPEGNGVKKQDQLVKHKNYLLFRVIQFSFYFFLFHFQVKANFITLLKGDEGKKSSQKSEHFKAGRPRGHEGVGKNIHGGQ